MQRRNLFARLLVMFVALALTCPARAFAAVGEGLQAQQTLIRDRSVLKHLWVNIAHRIARTAD